MASSYTKDDLIHLQPTHDTLVGIDSDGCVFDTMGIKQKQCFHTEIIRHWGLEGIETQLRQAAEFVNLYSKWRGINRFPALLKTFELLADWPEVQAIGVALPSTRALEAYIDSGLPLSNAVLQQRAEETGDEELKDLLAWSLAVNENVACTVKNIPPFKGVRECLEKMRAHSDLIVVSQTPEEALVREWDEHDIHDRVSVIAGQELGTKGEHLAMASDGKYAPDRILMIGDAPGDRKAANAVQAFFYPINPGQEEASWERLHREAYDKFLAGEYAGDYQDRLSAEFEALLPETPPWKS